MLRIAYHPCYSHPLPEGHRFPMLKYELLPEQLLHEGSCSPANFFKPSLPPDEDITSIHEPAYFDNLKQLKLPSGEARKIGFPLSEQLVERERIIAEGTMKSCDYAIENAIAMNIAGGTHHAFSNRGRHFAC